MTIADGPGENGMPVQSAAGREDADAVAAWCEAVDGHASADGP